MIVTFTANPSVDRTFEVEELVRGALMRARSIRVDGGGKGVNVTRALAANGHRSVAVLPSGGAEGVQLLSLLAVENLLVRAVPVHAAIRANVTIVEPDGTTTKINEPGPHLSAREVSQLTTALLSAAAGAEWAVLSGSLPPGAPEDLYATLTGELRAQGVRVALDTYGTLLRIALAAGPDVIKPNRSELADASGSDVDHVSERWAQSSGFAPWAPVPCLPVLAAAARCSSMRRAHITPAPQLPRAAPWVPVTRCWPASWLREAPDRKRFSKRSRGGRPPSRFPAVGCPCPRRSTAGRS